MWKPIAVYECGKGIHAVTLLSERRDKMVKNDGYKPQPRSSVPIIRLLDDNLTELLFSWLINEKTVRI
ncbi:hypothetical protein QE197_20535 (plasmid) [Arsenophonus nasoniae]|uniref:Transposase n=1 Tax=Arsenophonus nasoniae TaxID=638 RepID=A0AA95KBL4_9GAMM|nr:hypothetical protein [Arsenophonus nasoniae]WGM03381.1 hypothetical protein QE210_17740 [Arsenophonus nasoniae]WGM07908.1 hypothetical protein QE258_21810 [Arsenophonus nasoniae]WGM12805.1 hypothetical protein QE197_20535 [Arsenophonus nasoniae]